MRANCWFGKTWSWGRWIGFHVLPEFQIDWIIGNGSVHFEFRWLLWDFKVNTFWKERPITKMPEVPDSIWKVEDDSE